LADVLLCHQVHSISNETEEQLHQSPVTILIAIEPIVDYGFGPVASIVFSAGRLRHEAGGLRPPLVSPAPMARRRAWHWYLALGPGFGGWH